MRSRHRADRAPAPAACAWARAGGLLAGALLWALLAVQAAAATLPVALQEFKHDAWSIERGAPSRINSITQTLDGFLWIGSVEGLFRFDGVSFEPQRLWPEDAQRLVVSSLWAARSGALWVGLARGRGVAVLRDGQLVDAHMPHPSREVNDITEDAEGGIWVARGGRSDRLLARYHRGTWQEFGPESGLPAQPVWKLHVARDGTLWVVLSHTLAYRRPGETRFSTRELAITPRASLSEDGQGRLWLSDNRGTRLLEAPAGPDTFFPHPNPIGGTRLLFDRRGELWTTTWNSGVLRISAPGRAPPPDLDAARRVAALDSRAGLSSDQTRALFQDREGNIWVGTELGLDQLRPASVVAEADLPPNSPSSYRLAAARDGTVYVADAWALYLIAPGQRPRRLLQNDSPAEALCAAGERGVWLFLADRLLRVDGAQVQRHAKPAGTTAYGCTEDSAGQLWMPGLERGLYRWQAGSWQRWPEPTPSPSLPANAVQDHDGRAVVLFRARPPQGELPFLALDATRSAVGGVEGLLPSEAGLLISGAQGLARAQGGVLLGGRQQAWAASLNGLAQTRDGDTWVIGDAGLVRLRSAELAAALQAGGRPPAARVLDFHDGLNSFVQKAPGAQVAVGGDGRVWLLTRRQVMRINPAALVPNPLPPPVVVRAVQVGEHSLTAAPQLALPAGTTTLRVTFTALSLSVPSRVQFRHRLLGADEAWSAPSPLRTALLTDLRPGDYRFEVQACNNDGLWSDTPATVALHIPATFTQTGGFKLAVVGLGLLLLYGAYLLRVRQIRSRLRERGEERLRERERIARDMHDTLLQSVQGLILRVQAVADRLSGEHESRRLINEALDRAETVLIEGRERLQGLRRVDASDLTRELHRLIAEQPFAPSTEVSVSSHGPRKSLRPELFDELLCILGEALFNAARHAQASQVAVRVDYGRQWLEITVRDNGVGLSPAQAQAPGRSGHFGILGMRERAQRLGGQFRIHGHSGLGTFVTLRIKAAIAYADEHGVPDDND